MREAKPFVQNAHLDILIKTMEHGDYVEEEAHSAGETRAQIRQLIKQALETPTPDGLVHFMDFATRFRRLAIWNAWMARIQRPGAHAIASEYEWARIGRAVLPDAVPIIILWPFSPIRFVYELADTGPPIDREAIRDPFAVVGSLPDATFPKLTRNLKQQKKFKVIVELRRQGFNRAGHATVHQPSLPFVSPLYNDHVPLGALAAEKPGIRTNGVPSSPSFRIVINDALEPKEQFVTLAHELGHIFCGHLGGCTTPARDNDQSGWPDRRFLDLRSKEIEAEAVAYLISARAGLLARSAAYLRTYVREEDIARIDYEVIIRAAARIERLAEIHYGAMLFKGAII